MHLVSFCAIDFFPRVLLQWHLQILFFLRFDLLAHLQEHLHYLQSRYPGNLADQARDIIGRLLPTGECCIERVATALGMHERTLQSRLQQNGESYRGLLQQVRQSLAEQQLRYGAQTITELALQLGYAEVAVFSRHFRRWTGISPRAWQKQHRP